MIATSRYHLTQQEHIPHPIHFATAFLNHYLPVAVQLIVANSSNPQSWIHDWETTGIAQNSETMQPFKTISTCITSEVCKILHTNILMDTCMHLLSYILIHMHDTLF